MRARRRRRVRPRKGGAKNAEFEDKGTPHAGGYIMLHIIHGFATRNLSWKCIAIPLLKVIKSDPTKTENDICYLF